VKLGIIGTGNVGCAIALAAVTRGRAREIVLVNHTSNTAPRTFCSIEPAAPPVTRLHDGNSREVTRAPA